MRAIYLIVVVPLTAGCSLLPVGEGDFSCPRDQYGVHCLSAREVYQATNTTDRLGGDGRNTAAQKPEPTASGAWQGWQERDGVKTTAATPAASPVLVAATRNAPASVPRPGELLPLRTPAQVMRIWIAPWEDAAGNLHAPGAVFTEIEPRRWQIGLPAMTETTALQPLQVERRESTVAATPTTAPPRPLANLLNSDTGGHPSRTQPRIHP